MHHSLVYPQSWPYNVLTSTETGVRSNQAGDSSSAAGRLARHLKPVQVT